MQFFYKQIIFSCILLSSCAYAASLPQGGELIKGQGHINYQSNDKLNVSSGNKNNVIKWDSFDIGKDSHVTFDNKNYLNLVKGTNPTLIEGKLSANGNLFVVNPNGVSLAAGSYVSAPTFGISTAKFNDKMINNFVSSGTIELSSQGMGKVTALSTINTDNLIIDGGQLIIKAAENIKTYDNTKRLQHGIDGKTIKLKSSTKRIDIGSKKGVNLAQDFNVNVTDGFVDHAGQIAISNKEEFKKIFQDLDGEYWITNDITLDNLNTSISSANAFEGMLDGAFNKIKYDISYDYSQSSSDYPNLGLFAELNGAKIQNLKIANSSINITGDNISENIGALAGVIKNSTLENIAIENFAVNFDGSPYLNGTINVGALAGSAIGTNNLSNITSYFASQSEKLVLDSNLHFGSVFGSASDTLNTFGLVSGNKSQLNLNLNAIGTNNTGKTINSTFSEGILDTKNDTANSVIMQQHFVINKDNTNALHAGFLKPFFAENYTVEYDGKLHSYGNLASNSGFNINNYIQVQNSDLKNVGIYDVELLSNANQYYFILTDGSKSFTSKAKVTITPRNLGEIILGDLTIKKEQINDLKVQDVINNLKDLNFAPDESINDLNFEIKLTPKNNLKDSYELTLTPSLNNPNYVYSVKKGNLIVKEDPIRPEIPDLPSEKTGPDFKKATDRARCDFCTVKKDKKIGKNAELKFDKHVQGMNVEKSKLEIAEFDEQAL